MVPASGAPVCARELRPLNLPRPLPVVTDPHGRPRLVGRAARSGRPPGNRGPARRVRRILDRWRVDDTWWRDPVCRIYWELELDDGEVVTVYHDRIEDRWYAQRDRER